MTICGLIKEASLICCASVILVTLARMAARAQRVRLAHSKPRMAPLFACRALPAHTQTCLDQHLVSGARTCHGRQWEAGQQATASAMWAIVDSLEDYAEAVQLGRIKPAMGLWNALLAWVGHTQQLLVHHRT